MADAARAGDEIAARIWRDAGAELAPGEPADDRGGTEQVYLSEDSD